MSEVVLSYRREKDAFQGSIFLREEDEKKIIFIFSGQDFRTIMQWLSDSLRQYPDSSAVIERTDRDGIKPIKLTPSQTNLLREDPEEALKQMEPPHEKLINIGKGPSPVARIGDVVQVRVPLQKGLVVGHDSFADAFGDRLYCRANEGKIECPGCGHWMPIDTIMELRLLDCTRCDLGVIVDEAGSSWWSVDTYDLLMTDGNDRFFFPRAWNKTPPWISRDDLQKRYDIFIEEKSNARG